MSGRPSRARPPAPPIDLDMIRQVEVSARMTAIAFRLLVEASQRKNATATSILRAVARELDHERRAGAA